MTDPLSDAVVVPVADAPAPVTAGIRGVTPFADAHPLLGLKILIMSEEMLDLLEYDRRKVMPFADVLVVREGRIHRHADQLLVAAMLIFQVEDTDRSGANDAAGHEG